MIADFPSIFTSILDFTRFCCLLSIVNPAIYAINIMQNFVLFHFFFYTAKQSAEMMKQCLKLFFPVLPLIQEVVYIPHLFPQRITADMMSADKKKGSPLASLVLFHVFALILLVNTRVFIPLMVAWTGWRVSWSVFWFF